MLARASALATLWALLSACASGTSARASGQATPAAACNACGAAQGEPVLPWPATPSAREVLDTLAARAAAGDRGAAATRLHYLVDLFDVARFGDDAGARRLLFAALGGLEARGQPASLRIAAGLQEESERLAAGPEPLQDELCDGLRLLLRVDGPTPRRSELWRLSQDLRRLAGSSSPLAANALLRLYGLCASAMRRAAAVPRLERPAILRYCLYPLYESDPEPYFSSEAEVRPPDPPWTAYTEGLAQLIARLGATPSRLSSLAAPLAAAERVFLERQADRLPPLLELAQLPGAARALAFDGAQPLLRFDRGDFVEGGMATAFPADLASGVSGAGGAGGAGTTDDSGSATGASGASTGVRIRGDAEGALRTLCTRLVAEGDGLLALAAPPAADALAALRIGAISRQVGGEALLLVVRSPVHLRAPRGDYWGGRGEAIDRPGALPLSLALLPGPQRTRRAHPPAIRLHDRAAPPAAVLRLGKDAWVLVTPGGSRDLRIPLAATTATDPGAGLVQARNRLRTELERIARAPAAANASATLALQPEGGSYGALVAAVEACRTRADGRALFPQLTLVQPR